MEDLEARPRSLSSILSQTNEGSLVIPEFQRDFVWKPSNTVALLTSIIKDYPAGNLLFWKFRPENSLQHRPIEGVTKRQKTPEWLILDGQQRLTCLYQTFFGRSDHRFFIDLEKLSHDNVDEDTIKVYTDRKIKKEGLNNLEKQFELKLMPLEAVFSQISGYPHDWKMKFIVFNESRGKKATDTIAWFEKIENEYIDTIRKYRFAVTELPASMEMEAVCQIFENLNNSGIRLGVFELLTARLYSDSINLRELWDKSQSEYPIIRNFSIDSVELLKTISLLRSKDCKRKSILGLSNVNFVKDWETSARLLSTSLTILQENCGVINKRWLPYTTILSPMSALLIEMEKAKGAKKIEIGNKIEKWFWCSVFNRNYDASTDTRAMKDYAEMLKWLGDDTKKPDAISNFSIQFVDLINTIKPSDAVYRGIICLIIKNKAMDFHDGRTITLQQLVNDEVDDHHIFPQAYLVTKSVSNSMINSILNKTLISATTNRAIKNKAPEIYLKEIESQIGSDKLIQILKSHMLISDSAKTLPKDFDKFIEHRKGLLDSKIKEVTS